MLYVESESMINVKSVSLPIREGSNDDGLQKMNLMICPGSRQNIPGYTTDVIYPILLRDIEYISRSSGCIIIIVLFELLW